MKSTLLMITVALLAAACQDSGKSGAQASDRGPHSVPVTAKAVRVGALEVVTQYPGELDTDVVELAAKTAGRVERVNVRIGDRVEQGDVIARIDDTALIRERAQVRAQVSLSEAAIDRADAQLAVAKRELSRTEPLLKNKLVSDQHVDNLRTKVTSLSAELAVARAERDQAKARAAAVTLQIREARILAPFPGAVSARHVDPGAMVAAGEPIARLVRSGPLRVRFRVPARDIGAVKPGLPLVVTTDALPGKTFAGAVKRVAAEVRRDDRTVLVEGMLEAADPALRAGMFAEVEVSRQKLEDVLIVPAVAVIERLEGAQTLSGVLVAVDGQAQWRPVEILGVRASEIAVAGKLASGDKVLVVGHEHLAPGAAIRVIPPAKPSGERRKKGSGREGAGGSRIQ